MNDIIGYCYLKSNPTTFTSPRPLKEFQGQPMRCLEINENSEAILCVNPEGTGLAMVDFCDVSQYFKCTVSGEFILPDGLDMFNQFAYMNKLSTRKGGYNDTLRQMIIINSLRCGKYNDNFIFQKENEEKSSR